MVDKHQAQGLSFGFGEHRSNFGPGRPSNVKTLNVWMNGVLVGEWSFSTTGGYSFAYAESWLEDRRRRPISLSLPLTVGTSRVSSQAVYSYFDNLLPDSDAIRDRDATHYGVKSTKAFDLLEMVGRDCVGAVQLLPVTSPTPNVELIESKPLTESEIEALLSATITNKQFTPQDDNTDFRISIAGAQEKTALLWHDDQWQLPLNATPTTHIIKLPLGKVGDMEADFSTSVENEWLCGQILNEYGLPTAGSEIAHFGKYKALVVERFDRRYLRGGWIARLPQEDFCQVFGIGHTQKYESHGGPGIDAILDKLRGSTQPETDRRNFLKTQLIFWLLAATDGHAKNFSIQLLVGGEFKLTPLYDVMSAWPIIGSGAHQLPYKKAKLAMALRTKNAHYHIAGIQRRHWNEVAKRNALGNDFEPTIEEVIAATPNVLKTIQGKLPSDFPMEVAEPIFSGITRQVKKLSRSLP